MKELRESRLNEISRERESLERLGGKAWARQGGESLSASEIDDRMSRRMETGGKRSVEAAETRESVELRAVKDEINAYMAERYHTTPEFEALRSKSKINALKPAEAARYEAMKANYPDRAALSNLERMNAAYNYDDCKKNKMDFQVVDAFKELNQQYKLSKTGGKPLDPAGQDLRDKLEKLYVDRLCEKMDEFMIKNRLV